MGRYQEGYSREYLTLFHLNVRWGQMKVDEEKFEFLRKTSERSEERKRTERSEGDGAERA